MNMVVCMHILRIRDIHLYVHRYMYIPLPLMNKIQQFIDTHDLEIKQDTDGKGRYTLFLSR